MAVRQLPPRDYFNSLVSLLSLYGTKTFLPDDYPSTWMQFPNASNDLLILAPSICLAPFWPPALSDPARSTNDSLPMLTYSLIPDALSLVYVLTSKIEWDREEI